MIDCRVEKAVIDGEIRFSMLNCNTAIAYYYDRKNALKQAQKLENAAERLRELAFEIESKEG